MRCPGTRFILLIVFAVTWCPQARAFDLRGTLSSDLYSFERQNVHHVQPYVNLSLNLTTLRTSPGRRLDIHSNARWVTDISDQKARDAETLIRTFYVSLRGYPRRADIRIGRQFVHSHVGSAFIDGVRLQYGLSRRVQLEFHGGAAVSLIDPERTQSFDEEGLLGARVSLVPRSPLRISLAWMHRESENQSHLSRLGVNVEYRESVWRGRLKIAMNTTLRRLAEVLARISRTKGPWYTMVEFRTREPSVSNSSLFSIVDFKRYRQFRLELSRRLGDRTTIVTRQRLALQTDDNTWHSTVGLMHRRVSVGWRFRTGYGGDQNGLYASASRQLHRAWRADAAVDLSRYQVQDEQEKDIDAYAARFAMTWQATRTFNLRWEVQYLRNAVASSDVRLLIRATRHFSLSSSKSDVQP